MAAAVTQRRALCDRMERVLGAAMLKRSDRLQVGDFGDGYETRWVHYERHLMLAEVNQARAEQGHGPITVHVLKRVEQVACGHVDYFQKFALYCAELALNESWALRDGGAE